MKAIDRPLTKIIDGTTQFVIPVFQRDYSWTEAQCDQLWKDIMQVAEGGPGDAHFLGSMVYVSTGDSSAGFTRWLLIDGQQRMTTIALLLTALRDHIRESGWAGTEDGPTAKRIDAYFLRNVQEEGDRESKLVLRRFDQATLEALVHGRDRPTNAARNILTNYGYFRELMREADPETVYRGVGRLVVVDVTLDRMTDDPQLIFESLNSTGMDLSQADLIRNFVLMRLEEREQTRLYTEYWSKIEALFRESDRTFDAFARDYVALRTQASKQEKASNIYGGFRRAFPDLVSELGTLEATLADMLRMARFYAAFALGIGGPDELKASLEHLRRLVDAPATLVMRLYERFDESSNFSLGEFRQAIQLIESYVLRRVVCGLQTRGYWQIFANLAYRIRPESPLEDLRVGFALQRENYRFPSDEQFWAEIQSRELYGLRVCAHLLDRLENHDSREPTDTSNYTIEHVLPQNERLAPAWKEMLGEHWRDVQRTWLHRLGNLTLTGYNSTYSDRPFEQKKTIAGGFAESSVRLNRFIREQPRWTEEEMSERGRLLADQALRVWPANEVDPDLKRREASREKRRLAERRDVGRVDMSETARALFDVLRDAVLELGAEVIEMAEYRSVSYHGPDFFLEVLPRANRLVLLLALDFNEVVDPDGMARDASTRKFFANAKHEGGVSVPLWSTDDIPGALRLVRQAFELTRT